MTAISERVFAYKGLQWGNMKAFIMHKLHLKPTGRFCQCLKLQQKELNAFQVRPFHVC